MENRKEIITDIIDILSKEINPDSSFYRGILPLCETSKEVQEFKQHFKDFVLPISLYNNMDKEHQYRLFLLHEYFLSLIEKPMVQKYIECVHQLKIKSTFDEKDFYQALIASKAKVEKDELRNLPLKTKLKILSENIKTSLFAMDKENEEYIMKLFRRVGKR